MRAVITTGEDVEALRPMTLTCPKELVKVANEVCVKRLISQLINAGADDIAVLVGFRQELYKEVLKNEKVTVLDYHETDKIRDFTAGSQTVCLVRGDIVCDFDFKRIESFHLAHKGDATVVCVKDNKPQDNTVCISDRNGKLIRLDEKPTANRMFSDRIFTGVCLIKEMVLAEQKGFSASFVKKTITGLLQENKPVFSYESKLYFNDMADMTKYRLCHMDLLNGTARIGQKTDKNHSLIPTSCVCEGKVLKSCVGIRTRIEKTARIENSVVGSDCIIGKNVLLRNCVVCDGCVLEDGVSVYDDAVVAEGCHIKRGAVISCRTVVNIKSFVKENEYVDKEKNNEKTSVFDYVRRGSALAAVFGGTCVVSCENENCRGKLMSLCGGLLSCGCDVLDIGVCDEWIMRYTVRAYSLSFGAYVTENGLCVCEEDGLDITEAHKSQLQSDELLKTMTNYPGKYRSLGGVERVYKRKLRHYLFDMPALKMSLDAPSFLSDSVVSLPQENGDDLIVRHSVSSEQYTDDFLKMASLYAYGKTYGRVFVPYEFLHAAEKIGEEYGFDVVRMDETDRDRRFLYDMTDPYVRGAVLIRYLAKNDLTLRALERMLPKVCVVSKQVDVSTHKGGVLQTLIHDMKDAAEETDGAVFETGGAFVRIIPTETINAFKIVAEASDMEAAEELCDDFTVKIMQSEKKELDKQNL